MLQRFIDDVGVLVAMVVITFIALVVVIIKVILVHNEVRRLQTFTKLETRDQTSACFLQVDNSVATFKPMEQMKESKIKYTGIGFIPCNG